MERFVTNFAIAVSAFILIASVYLAVQNIHSCRTFLQEARNELTRLQHMHSASILYVLTQSQRDYNESQERAIMALVRYAECKGE